MPSFFMDEIVLFSSKEKGLTESAKPFSCRNEATRTPDPYVPNVVRYQLRYIPIALVSSRLRCKGRYNFGIAKEYFYFFYQNCII